MGYIARPDTAVSHRYVLELKYDRGELYWDRTGRITRTLANIPGWAIQSMDLNGCHLRKDEGNIEFNFSWNSLSLCQGQNLDTPELLREGEFGAIADEFSEAVIEALELDSFSRIGFRTWMLYPTSSLDEASDSIQKSVMYKAGVALTQLGALSHPSYSIVVARPSHMVRIAIAGVEQHVVLPPSVIEAEKKTAREKWKHDKNQLLQRLKARKVIAHYPQTGIVIDLDAFIEEPSFKGELSCGGFVRQATADFQVIRSAILEARNE